MGAESIIRMREPKEIVKRWSGDSAWQVRLAQMLDAMAEMYRIRLNEQIVQWWKEALGSFPIEVIEDAFQGYLSNPDGGNKFPPVMGDIVNLCQRSIAGERERRWAESAAQAQAEIIRDRERNPDKYFGMKELLAEMRKSKLGEEAK